MDYGFHPPTIYFPLIVPEALMIEPTETETKETLDAFCDAMLAIAREAAESPELLKDAPHNRPVRRLDEVRAAKNPVVKYGFAEHVAARGAASAREMSDDAVAPDRRLRGGGVVVLAVVLVHEALTPTPFHHRPLDGCALPDGGAGGARARLRAARPSPSAALGGGLAAGGALAMLVSGLVWQQGVPDPLVGGGYAFNLADIAIALGDAMLLAAVLVHAWDNRHSLRQTI